MSIRLRILQYLESKGITKYKFYQQTGISNGFLDKEGAIGSDKCEIICSVYPDLNPIWLLLGQESMDRKDENKVETMKYEPNFSHSIQPLVEIPIMDVNVAAGITGFINGNNFDTLDHIALPENMINSGVNVCVRVKGDSMSPTLYDSDRVIIRMLDQGDWSDMPDDHIYVIVDAEGKGYLKRVRNRLSKGFIVCTSDNLDKANFPNFNLQVNEIISIWHAEWRIGAKMPNINESYYSRLRELEDDVSSIKNSLKALNK